MYDFETVVDRTHSDSAKWTGGRSKNYPEDILGMWTADMDFEVCPAITEALRARVCDHRIYGYNVPRDMRCHQAVCAWMKKRHNWEPKTEWIVNTPGVVVAVAMAVQTFTQAGDAVLIQRPVYYPFTNCILNNHRKVVNSPLKLVEGKYEIDFADFEQKIIDHEVKLFILCNPHNPTGRVWTREELTKLGNICLKHHVLVVSDEIHCDFVYSPHRYTPFASICEEFAQNSVICTAASKTFNIAGLRYSTIFVPNPELRGRYLEQINACAVKCNLFGSIATRAAYEEGEAWFDEVLAYIAQNIRLMKAYLAQELPMLKVIEPEGLYLVWVDFSAFHLSDEALTDFMINDAHVWLDEGYIFGQEGHDYERFNLACSSKIVRESIDRIKRAAQKKGLI